MDIYSSAFEEVKRLSTFGDWKELLELFQRLAEKQQHGWVLPKYACLSVGGDEEDALKAVAAFGCLQIGIILIDDMLDLDPRGYHHEAGEGAAANMADGFHAAGAKLILESSLEPSRKLAALESIEWMMGQTAFGQYLDIKNPDNEIEYWNMVKTKSSPYFASGLEVGGLFGGSSLELAAQLRHFGELYGEIVQIYDDLKDTMTIPAGPDWHQGRLPLPILYASLVDYPEKGRFMELRSQVSDAEILKECQQILISSGAVSYCVSQLVPRYVQVKQLIMDMDLVDRAPLLTLLDDIIHPTLVLMDSLDLKEIFEKELAFQPS